MNRPKLYKATELADILRVHPQTIYRLAERGEIESYRIGKSVRFLMPEKRGQNNEENTSTEDS